MDQTADLSDHHPMKTGDGDRIGQRIIDDNNEHRESEDARAPRQHNSQQAGNIPSRRHI